MIFYECFCCGKPIRSTNEACPHCGYKFTDNDNGLWCPNRVGTVCQLTENICNLRGDYGKCPTKNRYDREDDL